MAGYNVVGQFEDRVELHCGRELHDGQPFDRTHGYLIESLGQGMNLMLSRSASLHATAEEALACLAQLFDVRRAA